MFTLQSLMLVALGVLFSALIAVTILPVYRGRVRRLTSDEIRRSVPLTEAEIRADTDKLRAQFAIRVHKLEAESEQQKLSAARQRIEMNRRDAKVTELQDEIDRIRAALEENVNARRVLEHTVTDRLPRLEQQLESARTMISERDDELGGLRSQTNRSVRALDEALQINAQQRAELERLSSSHAARMPLPRETIAEAKFDGELALRSEIEALRAKTREQASQLQRLQSRVDGEASGASPDVEQLRRELAEAEAAARAAREAAQAGGFDRAAAEAQAKAYIGRIDEQAAEIVRLNAALSVFEGGGEGADLRGVGQGSRLAAKARISAMQTQLTQQTETIQRLRSELAASNERLARQAAHYMEEMRRLGAGTVPTTIDPRRGRDGPRRGLADRISQTSRPSISASGGAAGEADGTGPLVGRISDHIKSLSEPAPLGVAADRGAVDGTTSENGGVQASSTSAPVDSDAIEPPKRRMRLLERIASAGKG